jgi:DNA repair photolyase
MKAINPSGLWKKKLGDWALNPYLGCEHGCFHCYVPAMPGSALFSGPVIDAEGVYHEKPPARTQRDWGNYIFLKAGFVEALQNKLSPSRTGGGFTPEYARERALINRGEAANGQSGSDWYEPGWILVSFLTDCYTPLEGKFKVTRQVLKLLLEAGHKVRIQTRSAMVERDFDILAKYPEQVLLGTSIPYLDDDIARVLEPKSSSPTRRDMMIQKAAHLGIPTYVAIAPVMPFNDLKTNRPLYLDAFAQAKVVKHREIFCEVLNPKGDNIAMIKDALAEGWKNSDGEVAKKCASAFVDLDHYDEERWARATARVLSRFVGDAASGIKITPWPDTSRRWAKHLDVGTVMFLDGFLPPSTIQRSGECGVRDPSGVQVANALAPITPHERVIEGMRNVESKPATD